MPKGVEDDQEVAIAFAWIHSVVGPDLLSRIGAAMQHFSASQLPPPGSIMWPEPNQLIPPNDRAAGMLLQAFALLRDGRFFDARLAPRVISFLKLIGSALPELSAVEGADDRVKAFIDSKNDHPEGTLLELAVAARYLLEGYQVRFIPESSQKTPDMELVFDNGTIQVECKRLRAGLYELKETAKVRTMFSLACDFLSNNGQSAFIEVTFKVEIDNVQVDHLRNLAKSFVDSASNELSWNNDISRGRIIIGDIQSLHDDTQDSYLLMGPKMVRLFAGKPVPVHRTIIGVDADPVNIDPRYLENFRTVVVCSWENECEASISARARHVRSKLAEIDAQMANCDLGAAHIVVDAERDSAAADLRRQRIRHHVESFNFKSPIVALTTHYLLTHTAELRSWTIDETADPATRMSEKLLEDPRLFIDGSELGEAPAWHQPLPE